MDSSFLNMDRFVISVDNALIQEIWVETVTSGYVIINYADMDSMGMVYINTVRLNVNQDTVILSPFAEELTIQDLEVGMKIAAVFSAAMTRSIPPQSSAYSIVVKADEENVVVHIDRVVSVDMNNNFLYTGNPYDISDQMRYVITNATIITDRDGNRISLSEISPGQMVRVEHANFQTASIPPQTTAFAVEVY